jgi:hypothetical protein
MSRKEDVVKSGGINENLHLVAAYICINDHSEVTNIQ